MSCAIVRRIRQAFVRAPKPSLPRDLACPGLGGWSPPPKKQYPPHPGVRLSLETKVRDEAKTQGWPIRTAIRVCVERNSTWPVLQLSQMSYGRARPDSTTLGAYESRRVRCGSELTMYEYDILSDMVGDIDFKVPLTFKIGA